MVKLNNAIAEIKVKLQQSEIKKSGMNTYANFSYYELSDFLPSLNVLMSQNGINDHISFNENMATLTLVKDDEKQEYSIPFRIFDTPLSKNGSKSMQDIQYLGALITYYKRYLYMNAFGISDGEVVDSLNNEKLEMTEMNNTKKELGQLLRAKGKDTKYIKEFAKYYKISNDKNKILTIIDNLDDSIYEYEKNNQENKSTNDKKPIKNEYVAVPVTDKNRLY